MKKGWVVIRHEKIIGFLKNGIEMVDDMDQMTWFDADDPKRGEVLETAIQQDHFAECLILECIRRQS